MQITAFITTILATVSLAVYGQAVDQAYVSELLSALNAHNYTAFAGAIQAVANTTEGAALLAALPGPDRNLSATPDKTLFVPVNKAFAALPESVSSNTTLLANILSYHFLRESTNPLLVATEPNHTIVRSMYKNAMLPGNASQVVVCTQGEHPEALNASMSFPYQNNPDLHGSIGVRVKVANFMAIPITAVLSLPQTLEVLARSLLPQLAETLDKNHLLQPLSEAKGITVFATTDAAMSAAGSIDEQLNSTQIRTLLNNHIINGSVVYSTLLTGSNYTSAAGEPFTFITNATGAYVTSGNTTAQIVSADIPIANGVIHIIDRVLINSEGNPAAAESAVSSYAAQATATTSGVNGGIVGASSTMGSATGASTSAKATSSAILSTSLSTGVIGSAVAILAGVFAGAALLF